MDTKTVFATCNWAFSNNGDDDTAYKYRGDKHYFLATASTNTCCPEWGDDILLDEFDSRHELKNEWLLEYDKETNSYWCDESLPETLADLLAALQSPEDK